MDHFEHMFQANPNVIKNVLPDCEPCYDRKTNKIANLPISEQLKNTREYIAHVFSLLNTNPSRIMRAFFINSLQKKQVAEVFKFTKDLVRGTNLTNHLKKHGFF